MNSFPLPSLLPQRVGERKVFDELRRPTFSGPCLRLHEVIKFLGYEKVREIDESSKNAKDFDANAFTAAGESVPGY
jgi:hypothetical protein